MQERVCPSLGMGAEVWPALPTAQEEEGHTQHHEEREEERGLKGGGEVCHLPP